MTSGKESSLAERIINELGADEDFADAATLREVLRRLDEHDISDDDLANLQNVIAGIIEGYLE